jgi:catechol 2,3-dioxygenase-like lactoylglutathione lyase family enzyme
MLIGIDHLVIAVEDPDRAAERLAEALGVTEGGGGRHERLGTYNRLVWLCDSYLELLGIHDPALARESWLGAPAVQVLAAGGGLATWAVATDAIEEDIARLRAAGSDLAEPTAGERERSDGRIVRWRLAVGPALGPEAPPFLIEHDVGAAEWTPDERAARAADPARLTAVEFAVDDVATTTRRWLQSLDLRFRPSLVGGGARDTDIGRQLARVRPRRDTTAPSTTIRLSIPGRRPLQADLFGCRWIVDD